MTIMQTVELLFLTLEMIITIISMFKAPNIRNIWISKIQHSHRRVSLRTNAAIRQLRFLIVMTL